MTILRQGDEPRRGGTSIERGSSPQPASIDGALRALHVSDPLARLAPPVWLYGAVVFAAAWLVFWIQPLAVRGVLPALGGAPAVWNTAMVFFQAALLAGYAFAHFLVRRLPPTGQLALLCVLWIGVAATAPAGGLRPLGEAPGDLPPVLWLLGTMAGALGLAFVAASSLTPLVQAWLARAGQGRSSADPYVLYAASNAGSVGALLAYPFLLEPALGLENQAWLWSAVLLGLGPVLIVLWLAASRGGGSAVVAAPTRSATDASDPATLPALRIMALAAVPSALLLAATRYIATDIASVPLLWIVPLALYLGTFIHAFARRQLISHAVLARVLPLLLIAIAIVYPLSRTIFAFGLAHLLIFVLAALWCHGALARLRPPAADLTRFYLLISTGGLIGGLLAALVAPLVFVDVYEHPIALALVAALVPAASTHLRRGRLTVAAVALVAVVLGLSFVLSGAFDRDSWLWLGTLALVALCAPALGILRARPLLLAGALLTVFLVPDAITRGTDADVARERSFFGVYRIAEVDDMRVFHHGTTLHGAEWRRPDGSIESRTTYYGIGTPYHEIFAALARRPSPNAIGLVGLGTGSLACHARPGDDVRIYEIDPVVVRLAQEHFSALRTCAPDAYIAVGAARLLLAREKMRLDVLALDAFTSHAIPLHLLTLEAFRIYLRTLAPDGVIAVHISNRHLDLEPVVAAMAERLRLAGRIKRYTAPEDAPPPRLTKSSHVAILARDEAALRALGLDAGWAALGPPDRVQVWTDDHASIVPVLRWW